MSWLGSGSGSREKWKCSPESCHIIKWSCFFSPSHFRNSIWDKNVFVFCMMWLRTERSRVSKFVAHFGLNAIIFCCWCWLVVVCCSLHRRICSKYIAFFLSLFKMNCKPFISVNLINRIRLWDDVWAWRGVWSRWLYICFFFRSLSLSVASLHFL